jgi:glycosyltransferase involved in cell wall biosynthesis
MNKPNLLYLTPITPDPGSPGLAIRAYHNLLALSSTYSIYLLVIPTFVTDLALHPSLIGLCEKIIRLPLHPIKDFSLCLRLVLAKYRIPFRFHCPSLPMEMNTVSLRRIKAAARIYQGISFQVIHVFRLYMYPYASFFRTENRHCVFQLDLDDIESLTRWDLRNLFLINKNKVKARQMEQEAKKYETLERNWLPHFDRIFACSMSDREKIIQRYRCNSVEVLPNIVRVTKTRREEERSRPFTFVFVGNFLYYPNLDGLTFFCHQILPIIRNRVSTAFTVKVVGRGIPWKLTERLSVMKEVDIAGPLRDTQSCYREADAAIVPIRAGGGTRIKALEAIAYRLPVVSTTKGVEGLDFYSQIHVLLGDTPSSFAEHCCQVMSRPDLRQHLVENAFSRFNELYTLDRIRQVLCGNSHAFAQRL